MLYDDFGNGLQVLNRKRWVCFFFHRKRRFEPVFREAGKCCTKGARCGKCGTFWRNV